MALPILDGNQSATTLSTIFTAGAHIPAHTVVSLGSTAISNITSAVSGSVVSVSNFPATQTIAGTVTANVGGLLKSDEGASGDGVQIYAYDAVSDKARMLRTSDNYPSVLAVDPIALPPISGTITVGNSVTIGSLPAISGTVTANVDQLSLTNALDFFAVNYSEAFPVSLQSEISGTVTANLVGRNLSGPGSDVRVAVNSSGNTIVDIHAGDGSGPISSSLGLLVRGSVTVGNSVTIGAMPNGALTTRFGTPTTANTAFATSAVTNTSRKYLLIQNVTTGSNVITVGIGFTPTTTQGIQLTAGAGITFESSYIPTGAVYVLSSVTASNFTILEA